MYLEHFTQYPYQNLKNKRQMTNTALLFTLYKMSICPNILFIYLIIIKTRQLRVPIKPQFPFCWNIIVVNGLLTHTTTTTTTSSTYHTKYNRHNAQLNIHPINSRMKMIAGSTFTIQSFKASTRFSLALGPA